MAPTALLSVSDKTGLLPLAKTLVESHGFQLISSGGTAKLLQGANIPVTRVADFTASPEILGGRVKTLHPRVHGGILAKRDDPTHQNDLKKQNIPTIDLVVVNLYPFRETIKNPNVSWDEAIENIDIGGPAMVRAAAKNHADVTILTSPNQYGSFLEVLNTEGFAGISDQMRKDLALEAFEHTASYDIAISHWMGSQLGCSTSPWLQVIPKQQSLRYGENPHQQASWFSHKGKGWGGATQLQGKELSTNNLLDLEAALSTIYEFGYANNSEPAAVVIKHTNPCGVSTSSSLSKALIQALDADRVSAFGGIVALNSNVDADTAIQLKSLFLECIVAPDFDQEAKEVLSKKANLRLLALPKTAINEEGRENVRSILGGFLVQQQDDQSINPNSWNLVTTRAPSAKEMDDLTFAWKLVRHVRSNAIVVASSGQSLGIGAGQMNRIGSAKLALAAAESRAKGAVLASDGFFPFDDTVRLAAEHGIKSIIQPGGSIRDEDSIKACNELGIAMLFTGQRHFLH